MKAECGEDEPAKAVHLNMHDIHYAALADAELKFQVNDHLTLFGALVRVEEVGGQKLTVRHLDKGYPQYPFKVPKAFIARQQRGYWLAEPVPENCLPEDEARGHPHCEPFTFSHFATGTTWEIRQPELDAYRAQCALAGYAG